MPIIAGGIAGGANILGGILGNAAASSSQEQAKKLMEQAAAKYAGIQLPTIQELTAASYAPETFSEYTPTKLDEFARVQNALQGIEENPELSSTQLESLRGIKEVGRTGFSEADMAALDQANRQALAADKSNREAILQSMAQRGTLSGGGLLAADLASGQQMADASRQAANQQAMEAANRRYKALSDAASLATGIRGQEFGQQATIAQAENQMGQFNAGLEAQRALANFQAQNSARQYNANMANQLASNQAAARNQMEQDKVRAAQGLAGMAMNKAGGEAGGLQGLAGLASQEAQRKANMWAGIGSGVGSAAGTIGAAQIGANATENAAKLKANPIYGPGSTNVA